jgi:hypothetical protein
MAVDRTLTTLDDVKAILEEDSADYDGVLTKWIVSASELIYKASGHREFKPLTDGPETRWFDFGYGYNPLAYEFSLRADIADAPTEVVITDDKEAEWITFDVATEVTLLPRIREPWEPIRRLRLDWRKVGCVPPIFLLKVTGSWGFPAVPDDISDACAKQVALWAGRNLARFSETFSVDENRLLKPRALDSSIRDIAESYKLDLL